MSAPGLSNAVVARKPRPFVKWAGGKTQLLPELLARVPAHYNAYYEPFVGGGALFFALAADNRIERATLSDANTDLVNTYRQVRDNVDAVVEILRHHEKAHSEQHYYTVRSNAKLEDADWRAARFIYLNKTGFNGLYRVNKSGGFNVPFGRYTNPTICDEENLRACAMVLRGADIRDVDFRTAAQEARRGNLVYFDPPYAPLSKTSSFTAYTAGGFGHVEQEALADLALGLKMRGVHVLLSNSSVEVVEKLYAARGFQIDEVDARRSINSKADRRGAVKEYIIR